MKSDLVPSLHFHKGENMNERRNVWGDTEEHKPIYIDKYTSLKRLMLLFITCFCFFISYYMWIKHNDKAIALPIALGIFSFILNLNFLKIEKEGDVWILFSIIVVITGFFYPPILVTLLFPFVRFMSSLKEKE